MRLARYVALCFIGAFFLSPCSYGIVSKEWEKKVNGIVWIAYSPTNANPNKNIEPTEESVKDDLAVLRQAGFTGLVTYGCSGMIGQKLPELAKEQGFQGLIVGIWNPANQKEIAAAIGSSSHPIVLGFCVGNEGLKDRYQLKELTKVMQSLRMLTGKPITTTEQIEDYADKNLLKACDWVFPNVHPYFHNKLNPRQAVEWTRQAYEDLKKRTDRPVLFKEVGLPTEGDPRKILTESSQEQYYLALAKTNVKYVYFEAFDLPWKDHLPIEPHWGLFHADRTPKTLAKHLIGQRVTPPGSPKDAFYVYLDGTYRKNHFTPSGYMGDTGDILISEQCIRNPHSGKTCIQVIYTAKGKGPHTSDYPPPCKWAGVYWQHPPDNWGTKSEWKDKGFDLSSYKRLTFWARSEQECRIEFKVGGINEMYGDSLKYARRINARLSKEWKQFEINLGGANLRHIIGGFCWASNWNENPDGAVFYLDDIRFEAK